MRTKTHEPAGTWTAAVHESGHAVVALALGIYVRSVTINGEEGRVSVPGWSSGRTWLPEFLSDDWQAWKSRCADAVTVAHVREMLRQDWRAELTNDVAGLLAEALDDEHCGNGRFLEGEDLAGHVRLYLAVAGCNPRNPVSHVFKVNGSTGWNMTGDYKDAWQRSLALSRLDGTGPVLEMEQAEDRCANILMSRWHLVRKLAASLMRRRTGTVSAAQLHRLLGPEADRPAEGAVWIFPD
jgi:hypothetical protein